MFPSFSLPTTTTWTLLARCGCFPALSRKGSGSQGQVSTRPLLGGSQVLNEAVSRIGHAVRAHQSSHPLIRLQYFQHSPRWKKAKSGECGQIMTAIKRAHGDVIVMPSLKPLTKQGCVQTFSSTAAER